MIKTIKNLVFGLAEYAAGFIKEIRYVNAAAAFALAAFAVILYTDGVCSVTAYAAESTRTIGYDVTGKTVGNKTAGTVTSGSESSEADETVHTLKYTPVSMEKIGRAHV